MQTFLPYDDFVESAECLDRKRLGKQRVEAYQIINILESGKTTGGWVNHPAVRMWRGHLDYLKLYSNDMIREWIYRGYKNTLPMYVEKNLKIIVPKWFGDRTFHASHRSNLLRKDPVWYGRFGWKEPDDLPYIWPS